MDLTREEYNKDPRIPCKYGINCYQRNTVHKSKYKHPPRKLPTVNSDTPQPSKKPKLDNGETNGLAANSEIDNTPQSIKTVELALNTSSSPSPNLLTNVSSSDFIKTKFLVDMPSDFYSFWNFCKNLNSTQPLMALKEVGLILVGPFDVLAGKFENTPEKDIKEYVLHWRYFYDPPEFQTVIRRNDNSGYHLGYFRDSPGEMPAFLAYNKANTDGTFTIIGDNLFAAVNSFLDQSKKSADPFMKTTIVKFSNLIQKEAENLKLNLSTKTSKITTRNNKMLARTFNNLGFIVPYDKRSQVGYRALTISNKELQALFAKLRSASGVEKVKLMCEVQEVLTNTNIAIDECDFGAGFELGLDMLSSGIESLNSITAGLLASCYRLVNRDAFAIIIESHMNSRKKHFDLSII